MTGIRILDCISGVLKLAGCAAIVFVATVKKKKKKPLGLFQTHLQNHSEYHQEITWKQSFTLFTPETGGRVRWEDKTFCIFFLKLEQLRKGVRLAGKRENVLFSPHVDLNTNINKEPSYKIPSVEITPGALNQPNSLGLVPVLKKCLMRNVLYDTETNIRGRNPQILMDPLIPFHSN